MDTWEGKKGEKVGKKGEKIIWGKKLYSYLGVSPSPDAVFPNDS